MKDEIPQSVIDSHVKNAAKARAEKAKKENSEESKGRVKNECEWNKQAAFKFVNQKLVCEQALWGALATGREKEGDLAVRLWNLNSTSKSPLAPRRRARM